MSTVSAPARPRKARAPRPAPAPSPSPAGPVERHGVCRLTLRIGGTEYRLRSFPPAPGSGLRAIWTLRKTEGPQPVAYAVASDGIEAHCTCPDHEIHGAVCKHIGALAALRLIPAARGGAR